MVSAARTGPARQEQVWVNGSPRALVPGTTLAALLAELGAQGPGVAVERNREVVRKADHGKVVLEPGDRIEVVRLVGGG